LNTGLYEQQDSNQRDLNLRGQFVTDEDGNYSFYCLRPTPYPVSESRQCVLQARR
jgi:catechol 1,2-dioxygenase